MTNESQKNEKQIQNTDEFWWHYSLDWFGEHEPKKAENRKDSISEINKLRNKNKSITGEEKFFPSYASYIRPKEILSQQIPASTNPEERVFIIVHEMYELAFKQMIFDLDVVARTLEQLNSSDKFKSLIEKNIPVNYEQYNDVKLFSIVEEIWKENKLTTDERTEKENKLKPKEKEKQKIEREFAKLHLNKLHYKIESADDVDKYIKHYENILFWQAAYFASNRLIVNAEKVLSALSCFLDITAFSGLQFSQFRPWLLPASGFQTEQFRTVQMILGKAECFNYKFFGMVEYLKKYKAWENYTAWKDINEMADLTADEIVEKFFYSVTDKQLHQRTEDDRSKDYKRDWESSIPSYALEVNEEGKISSKLCGNVNSILEKVFSNFFVSFKDCYDDGDIPISTDNNSDKVRAIKLKAFELCIDDFLKNSDPLKNAKEGDKKSEVFNKIKNRIVGSLESNIESKTATHWTESFNPEKRKGMQLLVDNFRDSFLLSILRNLSILDTTLHAIDHTKRNRERNLRASIINRPYYSFLERHVDFIDNQIGIVMDYERGGAIGGSGGGGKNYFEFAMRLYEMFPAFPAVDEYIIK